MTSVIERLVAAIAKSTGLEEPFNPGCSEEEVVRLEEGIGVRLPDDYRECLKRFNGQKDPLALSFPPGQLVFLSAAEVATLWAEVLPYSDRSFFDDTDDSGRIRSVVYDAKRVPIAYNESNTTYLFLDGIPGANGTPMQLILNATEADLFVVAASVSDLFLRYLRLLESGEMKISRQPEAYGGNFWFTTPDGSPIDYDRFARMANLDMRGPH